MPAPLPVKILLFIEVYNSCHLFWKDVSICNGNMCLVNAIVPLFLMPLSVRQLSLQCHGLQFGEGGVVVALGGEGLGGGIVVDRKFHHILEH